MFTRVPQPRNKIRNKTLPFISRFCMIYVAAEDVDSMKTFLIFVSVEILTKCLSIVSETFDTMFTALDIHHLEAVIKRFTR